MGLFSRKLEGDYDDDGKGKVRHKTDHEGPEGE